MMEFDFMGSIGWRDVVLLAAAVTGVYLVLSVMRLFEMCAGRRDSADLRVAGTRLDEPVLRLTTTGNMPPRYDGAIGLPQQGLLVTGIAAQRNYWSLRHLRRRSGTVSCAGVQGSGFEQYRQDENRHERITDFATRSYG